MKAKLVQFLAPHLDTDISTVDVPCGTRCAFTGEPIETGVPLKSVIKKATADIADTFTIASDVVSKETAICFKANRLLRGNLFIDSEGIQKPMISAESATKYERPTWMSLFAEYCENPRPAVFILTDESKRRLWIDACVTDGDPGLFQLYFNGYSRQQRIPLHTHIFRLSQRLIMEAHAHGFSKHAIRYTLFSTPVHKAEMSFQTTKALDKELAYFRGTYAFDVALFIAT